MESQRKIPVAYEVEVVVVGGSTAGVEAAVAAAGRGAKVFLAAERPYLGEDLCAPLRIWLPEGVEPGTALGRRLFSGAEAAAPAPRKGLPFTYTTDVPSSGKHKDTDPPSRLADGQWRDAPTQSVQYDGDVTVTIDLGEARELKRLAVRAFEKPGDYGVDAVAVHAGLQAGRLRPAGKPTEKRTLRKGGPWSAVELAAKLSGTARYLAIRVARPAGCGRLLLGEILVEGEGPAPTASAKPPAAPSRLVRVTTPGHVKRTLDRALLDAGVQFLFGCYATDVLRDEAGLPAGVVLANRAGRQAIIAKCLIDATDRAVVARLAGAKGSAGPGGKQKFRRVVIGGKPLSPPGATARTVARLPEGGGHDIVEHTLELPMADAGWASLAAAEHRARELTFHPSHLDEAEAVFSVPPDAIRGQASLKADWPGAAGVDVGACRPAGVERVYVLGGCIDVPRGVAEALLAPTALMPLGQRIGALAADEARRITLRGVHLPARGGKAPARGEVREVLRGPRPSSRDLPTIAAAAGALPVLGAYDVVVIGGGTSGAPAGIAAARGGARTLVVEYLRELGGVGTAGLIARYHKGRRVGFTAAVDRGVAALAGTGGKGGKGGAGWNPRVKAEWWRQALRKAGADVWLGCLGCGALIENDRVIGAVLATPHGRGVVLARVVIDATGNADVAAAAGAETVFVGPSHLAVQGTGLPPRKLGAGYTNTDYLLVDDADMTDVWRAYLAARARGGYDAGQLIDTRERRRVVGDYVLTILDQMAGRTFPDTVVQSSSNYDSHGYPVHPYFALLDIPPGQRPPGAEPYTPYRCLLPKGLSGMLVIGLGTSAHRDAMALIRMQADLQNQGHAAGTAAAMAVRARTPLRKIDVKTLQRHLVKAGNLPAEVLEHEDSFPLSDRRLAEAVDALRSARPSHAEIAALLAHTDRSLPLLRTAYAAAATEAEKLTFARFLGLCGDATGVRTLIAAVAAAKDWDPPVALGSMAEYARVPTRLDSLILALGRTRDRRAVPAVLKWARTLSAKVDLSHHRAVARALEQLADPAAAPVLAEVLARPGMSGHAQTTLAPPTDRTAPLREIVLARALYRCGDHRGIGEKLLRRFAADLRGVLARHARAVLETPAP